MIFGTRVFLDGVRDRALYHSDNRIRHVIAVKNLSALFVDYRALLVHNVVVGENIAAALEVCILDTFLCGFYCI